MRHLAILVSTEGGVPPLGDFHPIQPVPLLAFDATTDLHYALLHASLSFK